MRWRVGRKREERSEKSQREKRQEGGSGEKSKRGREKEREREIKEGEEEGDRGSGRKRGSRWREGDGTWERENISQRASRCECVGSDQQHIRLHRGPRREVSWLQMPFAKTDVWCLTQPNSCIWPAGQGSESSRGGSGDGGCLLTPKLYVMFCFKFSKFSERWNSQGVIWWCKNWHLATDP